MQVLKSSNKKPQMISCHKKLNEMCRECQQIRLPKQTPVAPVKCEHEYCKTGECNDINCPKKHF